MHTKQVILHQKNEIGQVKEAGRRYREIAKSANTRKAYQIDWSQYLDWCNRNNKQPIPADIETIEEYIIYLADDRQFKPSTIRRKVSSLAMAHQSASLGDPTKNERIKMTLQGIDRTKGVRPDGKKPISVDDLKAMVNTLDDSIKGVRDRALLLLGFAGAFRRSELSELNIEDLDFTQDGLKVLVRRSKTDQSGEGHVKGILYGSISDTCPIRSLKKWIDSAKIETGALFRGVDRHGNIKQKRLDGVMIARIVKQVAKKAGLDHRLISAHSLRAGFVTSAALAGNPEWLIMRQTGHKKHDTVRRYIREVNVLKQNASANLGL